MFCKFCNREVDPVIHIIQCPHCGGEAHEVTDHQCECAGCGRKSSLPISLVPASDNQEEALVKREVPISEGSEKAIKEEVVKIIQERRNRTKE